ncbi:hypothetical protein [Noviherbaspirillum sp.]|uniref:hypothetical protein n=1 Tax=Noviherbaspirillum sp. TaxID=1926288 RepID=UPI002B470A63|nr:hypothetical protein [Noviherbaspirillum sp.]HJV80945.1 hypothetical protein [Noviherbaspirillum sp.]
MDSRSAILLGLSVALTTALAGCNKSGTSPASADVSQTHFPGGVTSGGGTSGEIMARASSAGATAKVGGDEGKRGQAATPSGSVSGTPGIPEGAGGTTSGPAMGGTTPGAAGTKAAPAPK